ncbi:hypothetical protein PCE1_000547 [Barthelona sp. PCE]
MALSQEAIESLFTDDEQSSDEFHIPSFGSQRKKNVTNDLLAAIDQDLDFLSPDTDEETSSPIVSSRQTTSKKQLGKSFSEQFDINKIPIATVSPKKQQRQPQVSPSLIDTETSPDIVTHLSSASEVQFVSNFPQNDVTYALSDEEDSGLYKHLDAIEESNLQSNIFDEFESTKRQQEESKKITTTPLQSAVIIEPKTVEISAAQHHHSVATTGFLDSQRLIEEIEQRSQKHIAVYKDIIVEKDREQTKIREMYKIELERQNRLHQDYLKQVEQLKREEVDILKNQKRVEIEHLKQHYETLLNQKEVFFNNQMNNLKDQIDTKKILNGLKFDLQSNFSNLNNMLIENQSMQGMQTNSLEIMGIEKLEKILSKMIFEKNQIKEEEKDFFREKEAKFDEMQDLFRSMTVELKTVKEQQSKLNINQHNFNNFVNTTTKKLQGKEAELDHREMSIVIQENRLKELQEKLESEQMQLNKDRGLFDIETKKLIQTTSQVHEKSQNLVKMKNEIEHERKQLLDLKNNQDNMQTALILKEKQIKAQEERMIDNLQYFSSHLSPKFPSSSLNQTLRTTELNDVLSMQRQIDTNINKSEMNAVSPVSTGSFNFEEIESLMNKADSLVNASKRLRKKSTDAHIKHEQAPRNLLENNETAFSPQFIHDSELTPMRDISSSISR